MSLLWRLANQLCVNSSLSDVCNGFTWSVCRSLFITWKQFQKPHGTYPNPYSGQSDHLIHLSEWLKAIPAFWKLSIKKQSKTKKIHKTQTVPHCVFAEEQWYRQQNLSSPSLKFIAQIADMLAGQITDNSTLLGKLCKLFFSPKVTSHLLPLKY